ncbi:MAG: threonine--tRNA ligase [Planctomycetota bacterium]|nr:threonine--tRNA ligase [Planctomycetota bacterium]
MSDQIEITLPDGSKREYPEGVNGLEIAKSIGKGLLKAAVAIDVDGSTQSLRETISSNSAISIITRDSKEGLEVLRHSAAHVLADAISRLRPEVKLWKGPPVEDPRYGYYYDIDLGDQPITMADLPEIEKQMRKIIKANVPFEKEIMGREDARKLMADNGEDYKVATIDKLPDDAEISFFRSGEFVDLCKGPHVPSTGNIGDGIAVLSIAGAYFGDDADNKMLTRVYGHAFADRAQMDEHRKNLEEAAKRDHRRLGKDLDLFSTMGELGAGLVLWHPKGGFVRHKVEEFWRNEHLAGGYDIVYSPHVARSDLWETSGHLEFYKESMYSPIDIDGVEYLLKPMNCPFHIEIFNSKRRSYRDLPFRWAELGTVYRYESAGTLHGLMRVRGFTQDDAHLFLRPDQLDEEIERCLRFVLFILEAFGFEEYDLVLSTRPDKYVGEQEQWDTATEALRQALERLELRYEIDEGGGAFYGPKIDVKIKDSLGRFWQCSTVQADFTQPERFDMSYIDRDGSKTRPVMIHRALLGSLERFFGILVEHFGGAFPVWLAPLQAVVLSVGERHADRASQLADDLRSSGFRVEADVDSEKIGQKIRKHLWTEKVPFVCVVGDQEVESGGLAVRHRQDGDLGSLSPEEFANLLTRMSSERR